MQNPGEARIGQAVADFCSLAPAGDQARFFQDFQVLGGVRLGDPQNVPGFRDAAIAPKEASGDPDPGGMGQGLEQPDGQVQTLGRVLFGFSALGSFNHNNYII